MALIAGSEFLYGMVIYVLLFMLKSDFHFLHYLRHVIMPELVYTILVTLVLYQIILHINRRLEEEEKQKNKELKKAAATEKKEKKKQAGEAKKAQKANKPKKVKPKKVKKPKEPPKPQDILKIKPVSIVMLVLFVAGVSVLISVLSSGFYYNNSVSLAKDYYSNEQYEKAYDKLSGIKLNGSDKTLYEQASTIMYVQKQYDSYENYMKLNMKTEALDSLIKGVNRYNSLRPQAQELGIDNKITAVYKQIVLALQDTFKISETEAIGLSSMSDTDFTNYYY